MIQNKERVLLGVFVVLHIDGVGATLVALQLRRLKPPLPIGPG